MTFSEKINEWIKEAETRPGSALMILKLIAGRLQDLTEQNEELAAENIALQDGSRIKEYQVHIKHLEFQLDLLKRRFGTDLENSTGQPRATNASLLIYNPQGRVIRLQISEKDLTTRTDLAIVTGDLIHEGEACRLKVISDEEDIMLLFNSGRVETYRVANIPLNYPGSQISFEKATLLNPPHTGELLVCLMPLSRLPISDFFLQASRRGAVKKTHGMIFNKIFTSHYLGRGAIQKNDQALYVTLGEKHDRFLMVTFEGHLVCLEADELSFGAEEQIRMELTDHIVSAFVPGENDLIVCLTRNGKIIQRESASLGITKSPGSRGQALISPARLEQGTRFIGALSGQSSDWLVTLDTSGVLSAFSMKAACDAGSIQTDHELIAAGLIPLFSRIGNRT